MPHPLVNSQTSGGFIGEDGALRHIQARLGWFLTVGPSCRAGHGEARGSRDRSSPALPRMPHPASHPVLHITPASHISLCTPYPALHPTSHRVLHLTLHPTSPPGIPNSSVPALPGAAVSVPGVRHCPCAGTDKQGWARTLGTDPDPALLPKSRPRWSQSSAPEPSRLRAPACPWLGSFLPSRKLRHFLLQRGRRSPGGFCNPRLSVPGPGRRRSLLGSPALASRRVSLPAPAGPGRAGSGSAPGSVHAQPWPRCCRGGCPGERLWPAFPGALPGTEG